MTTLTEFKEIEAKATKGPWVPGRFEDTGFKNQVSIQPSIGAAYGAKNEAETNAAIIALSRSAFPALIAVAEGMATSMENLKPFFKDYVGQMVISKIPGWQEIDREFQQALAAYEAWKLNIEGEK